MGIIGPFEVISGEDGKHEPPGWSRTRFHDWLSARVPPVGLAASYDRFLDPTRIVPFGVQLSHHFDVMVAARRRCDETGFLPVNGERLSIRPDAHLVDRHRRTVTVR